MTDPVHCGHGWIDPRQPRCRRTEDPELLTRGGTYVYDLALDGALPRLLRTVDDGARAHRRGIDTAEAAAAPGVVAVYTGADLDLAPAHGFVKVGDAFARWPLARDRSGSSANPWRW